MTLAALPASDAGRLDKPAWHSEGLSWLIPPDPTWTRCSRPRPQHASTASTILKTVLATLDMVAVVLVLLALAVIAALNAFCDGLSHMSWGHC